jgi:hypothetical protein
MDVVGLSYKFETKDSIYDVRCNRMNDWCAICALTIAELCSICRSVIGLSNWVP